MKTKIIEITEILEVQSKNFEKLCNYFKDVDVQCESYLTGVKDKDFFRMNDNLLYIKKYKDLLKLIEVEDENDSERILQKLYNHKEYFEISIRLNDKLICEKNNFSEELLKTIEVTNENNKRLIILFKEVFDYFLHKIRQVQMRARFY